MRAIIFLSSIVLAAKCGSAQVNVLTHRYDNYRTGANLNETILTTSSVANGFGKLYSLPVDDQIYAQPLYVSSLAIAGKGTHNVVYVCTMGDTVYAFDADSNTGGNASPLWAASFIDPAHGITPVPIADIASGGNISGNVGIESTPVIDLAGNTIYLVARTKENGSYVQRLHALDIRSGAERPGSPVAISGSVPGTAREAVNGKLAFDPKIHNQRAGLALLKNQVLITWASHEDLWGYHGWVMTYDKTSLAQTGVFCSTPNGFMGGIWMAGWAPSIDDSQNAYVVTGNGTWDGRKSFGESVLRLNTSERLAAVDYFAPSAWQSLNVFDGDLGDTGFLLIPGTTTGIASSKFSVLYVLNIQHLGYEVTNDAQTPQVFDIRSLNINASASKGGPVYWNRPGGAGIVFTESDKDFVRGFPVVHFGSGIVLNTDPGALLSSAPYSAPSAGGGVLAVSGDPAGQSAIVWSSTTISASANSTLQPGMLRAFDAANGLVEIWDSEINSARDGVGTWAKFVPPVIANGHVYVATFSNQLDVYGLLQ